MERAALNEGRGRDPGDTSRSVRSRTHSHSAQRRPGPRPRRHNHLPSLAPHTSHPLNEGRGRDPGDTPQLHGLAELDLARSTKAGAETPATHEMRPKEENLPDSLNEGRGRDPGDTAAAFTYMYSCESAQRRPGPRPRRHGCMQLLKCSIFCAQRRPGPRPRRHLYLIERMFFRMVRSTKAGAETPATRSTPEGYRNRPSSLNEGRGRDPGDTIVGEEYAHIAEPAQRRPGPRPRRHMQMTPDPCWT